MQIWIRIVQHMEREAGFGFIGEGLDESGAMNCRRLFISYQPLHNVLQKLAQVSVTGNPHTALDVTRDIRQTGLSFFPQNDRRNIGVRRRWIGELWWIGHE